MRQKTTRCLPMTTAAPKSAHFREGKDHPRWLGEERPSPYPAGTTFGYLRLLSSTAVRRRDGKHYAFFVDTYCELCGRHGRLRYGRLTRGEEHIPHSCSRCAPKARILQEWKRQTGRDMDDLDRCLRDKWSAIKSRCLDPNCRLYKWYGGRGISISPEFCDSVVTFVEYVRSLPHADESLHRAVELDRIDNSRGYERGNLRWVTHTDNVRNRRSTIVIVYRGQPYVLKEFIARFTSLSYIGGYKMYRRGVTPESMARKFPVRN